jgi:hypothetical protein
MAGNTKKEAVFVLRGGEASCVPLDQTPLMISEEDYDHTNDLLVGIEVYYPSCRKHDGYTLIELHGRALE